MAVNLSAIKDLLLPGLRGIEGKYEQIPSQYDKIFTKHESRMALERTAEMRYLGLAQLKTEGGQTAFDNGAGERYVYNQEHTEIALGYAITRKAIDDNLYKTQFQPSNLGLIESFNQTKEIYGANVINTSTTYNASVGGDGADCVCDGRDAAGGAGDYGGGSAFGDAGADGEFSVDAAFYRRGRVFPSDGDDAGGAGAVVRGECDALGGDHAGRFPAESGDAAVAADGDAAQRRAIVDLRAGGAGGG